MQPFYKPLTSTLEQQYLRKCREGDLAARAILIEHNLRLVAHIVKKYTSASLEQEDMMSVGMIGLCKAVDTYNIDKGNRLVTYASRCIENEILMLLRQERKRGRDTSLYEPLGKDKDGNEMSLIDILEDEQEDVLVQIEQKELCKRLPLCMKEVLTVKEQQLIMLRYGLNHWEAKTQKEVGEMFGISRSYVSRMEKKALRKLREHL